MTGRGIGYLIILALSLLAGLATGYREIFFVVFCLSLVLLYSAVSALWGALTLRAGQALSSLTAIREETIRFEMRMAGFVPLPVLIKAWVMIPEFSSTRPGTLIRQEMLLLLTPGTREKSLSLTIFCPHRGAWDIGVDRLRVQDIFGFFSFGLLKGHKPSILTAHLTVYPAITELAGEMQPPLLSLEYAEDSPVTADHGDSFSGTRQYRDGDSLKRIHWIQSIRTQQLYTRQYDISAEQFTMLLLDTGLPMGANPAGCADMMTECAASLAFFYILHNQPIRLYCPAGETDCAAHTMDDFTMMYADLAVIPFLNHAAAFDTAVLSESVLGPLRALHILTYRLSHELLEALRPLTAKRCRVTCIVPPNAELTLLAQHARDVDVRLVPILCPEDIAAKLGDCL